MAKPTKRIPSALKHGIYSGLGLLPTESPAKFRKFKKQRFYEFLEKELAIRERLDVLIARAYKKLAYVRAIKSMPPRAIPAAPSVPLLESRPN